VQKYRMKNMLERISWLCLLGCCLVSVVFPDILIKAQPDIIAFSFPSDDGVHTPQWVWLVILGAVGFGACWAGGGLDRLRRSPLIAPLVFAAAVLVFVTIPAFRFSTAAWKSLTLMAGLGVTALVIAEAGSPGRRRAILGLVMGVGLAVAGYGFAQYFGMDMFRWSQNFGGSRMSSTLGNPNHIGGYFAVLTPLGLALFLRARTGPARLGWLVVTTAFACAVLLAQTRGAWIACGVATAWILFREWRSGGGAGFRPGRVVALGLVVAVIGFVLVTRNPALASRLADTLPRDFGQVAKRYSAAKAALLVWRDHPVIGIGPGCYKHGYGAHMAKVIPWIGEPVLLDRAVSRFYALLNGTAPAGAERQFIHSFSEAAVHNDFLQFLSETGAVGFGILAWLVLAAVRGLLAARKHDRWLADGLLAGGMAFALHAGTNFPMDIAPLALLFFLWLGIAGSMAVDPCRPAPVFRDGTARMRIATAILPVIAAGTLSGMIYASSVYSRAGNIYMNGGDCANAQFYFEQSRKADWDDRRENFYLGSMAFQCGKPREAVGWFEREIAKNPYYMDGHDNLGGVLGSGGDPAGAEVRSRRAVELNPAYASAYANLGVALLGQKRRAEAAAAFRRASELDPELGMAQAGLRQATGGKAR
jgi:O-antigen ligase